MPSACTRSKRSAMCSPVSSSSSPVGSSATSSAGRFASARAIAARCISPPDSCDGRWSARSASPTYSSSSRVLARRSASGTRASACGSSTFSRAVSIGRRKKRWNTNPMRISRMRLRSASERPATSRSSNRTSPLVGWSTTPIRCSSVDFPQPDGPLTATYSPRPTRSETSRSAATGPAAIGKRRVTRRASTTPINPPPRA